MSLPINQMRELDSTKTDFNKLIAESDDFLLICIKVDDEIYSSMSIQMRKPSSLESIITAMLHEDNELKQRVMVNLLALNERDNNRNKTIN